MIKAIWPVIRIFATSFVLLAVLFSPLISTTDVNAAVGITAISPSSGIIGTALTLTGSIDTVGGTVELSWDGTVIRVGAAASGTNTVNLTFNIPVTYGGRHNVTIRDPATGTVSAAIQVNVNASLSLTPASGTVGTTVTVTGSGFGASETGIAILFDSSIVKSGIVASSAGAWTDTFNIPESSSGASHLIGASGPMTSAGTVTGQNLSTMPSISFSPASGKVGDNVTVIGTGFAAGESNLTLTFDSETAKSGLTAENNGSWTTSFSLPDGPSGPRVIGAYGASTSAISVGTKTYTVTPRITVNPTISSPGSAVTVTGTGFGANEAGIVVILGSTTVTQGIAANSRGRWTASFTVPPGAGGTYYVVASGSNSPASTVAGMNLTISASLFVSPVTGTVGTEITVTGSSFGTNEGGISILYDGAAVASVNADSSGNIKTVFKIPQSANGKHRIGASGIFTQAAAVVEQAFTVTPDISVNPQTGFVTSSITISGTGFASGKSISISYDDQNIGTSPSQLTTSTQGSFLATISAPPSRGGKHKIRVSDGSNLRDFDWIMDNSAPPVPTLISPSQGEVIGWFGGAPVTFKWSREDDPSGVSYVLEVDTDPKFPKPQIRQEGLDVTQFDSGVMQLGSYYWRVKAIDRASNESAWSPASTVHIGIIPLWAFIGMAVLLVAVVGGLLYMVIRRRVGAKNSPKPDGSLKT